MYYVEIIYKSKRHKQFYWFLTPDTSKFGAINTARIKAKRLKHTILRITVGTWKMGNERTSFTKNKFFEWRRVSKVPFYEEVKRFLKRHTPMTEKEIDANINMILQDTNFLLHLKK